MGRDLVRRALGGMAQHFNIARLVRRDRGLYFRASTGKLPPGGWWLRPLRPQAAWRVA